MTKINSYWDSFYNKTLNYMPSKKTVNKAYKQAVEKAYSWIPKSPTDALKMLPYIGSVAGPIIDRMNVPVVPNKIVTKTIALRSKRRKDAIQDPKSKAVCKKIKKRQEELKQIKKEMKNSNLLLVGRLAFNGAKDACNYFIPSIVPMTAFYNFGLKAGIKAIANATNEMTKTFFNRYFGNEQKQSKVWQAGVKSAGLSLGMDCAKQVYNETLDESVKTLACEALEIAKDNCTIL